VTGILSPALEAIRAALHPPDRAPDGPCWNLRELDGLLPAIDPIAAAVLVGLVERPHGLQVLLTRRTDALRHHAGQVSFPGGRIEAGDADAIAAAVRETGEEVGIGAAQLGPLGYLDPIATVTSFRVCPVVAIVAVDYVARPDPREVDEVFEVPLERLMAPANLRFVPIRWRDAIRAVPEFVDDVHPGQRIWGVSASILLNLRQRLEAVP
jgi:8-oxo-dGTP pyrophosphatase MutT (NUDIX family)